MTATVLPVRAREAKDSDMRFIVDSWLGSLSTSSADAPARVVRSCCHDRVWHLATRERVLVGCSSEDPEYIVGWVCATRREPAFLLYAYTRANWRRYGLAKLLCETLGLREPIAVGAWSEVAEQIAKRNQLDYRPFGAKGASCGDSESRVA